MIKCLPSVCVLPGSIPNVARKQKKKNHKKKQIKNKKKANTRLWYMNRHTKKFTYGISLRHRKSQIISYCKGNIPT